MKEVDAVIQEIYLEIKKRYEIKFIEIGIDKDHVHFLVQSVQKYIVTMMVKTLESLTVREVFKCCTQVKK